MIEQIQEYAQKEKLNLYDVAVMTDQGLEEAFCQPCNACNDSYSIAKLFISTAIGILIDKNLLSLDCPITKILRSSLSFPYPAIWDKVTVRHALTHRMGLDYGVVDVDRDDINEYKTTDFLRYIFSYPPQFEPGEHYQYTDVPHYLLSRIITQITGRPADELINDRLQVPLGFRSSAWGRCPLNYTLGSTGAFLRAGDMVKLGWAYLNYGVYEGNTLFSPRWVKQAETEGFEIGAIEDTEFLGKGGMNGQMVMYSRRLHMAVAWHGYDPEERDRSLAKFLQSF